MAAYRVNQPRLYPGDRRHNAPAVAACPICYGATELVYNRNNQQVIVCRECHAGLTVPAAAWEIVRAKRQAKR